MGEPDKPPLSDYEWERIEVERYEIKKRFKQHLLWEGIINNNLFGGTTMMDAMEGIAAPRQPIRVCSLLANYAVELFLAESKHYPDEHAHSLRWMDSLRQKVTQIVIEDVRRFGRTGTNLSYHATEEEICNAVRKALSDPGVPGSVTDIPRSVAGASAHPVATKQKSQRLSRSVYSPTAARKLERYLASHGIGQTDFAGKIKTTDRTLRSFRSTGKISRDIFDEMAREMGLTREQLLS